MCIEASKGGALWSQITNGTFCGLMDFTSVQRPSQEHKYTSNVPFGAGPVSTKHTKLTLLCSIKALNDLVNVN